MADTFEPRGKLELDDAEVLIGSKWMFELDISQRALTWHLNSVETH